METDNKVYLFVSHSHNDIEKVRVIRNFLEGLGAEPILFFLKSKTDKDEITQLIKDEIDARYWFIYCRSQNSESSTWCQDELAYIEETKKQTQFTIDLDTAFTKDGDLTDETKKLIMFNLKTIIKISGLFVSYARKDHPIVEMIAKCLQKHDVRLFWDEMLSNGSDWGAQIENAIAKYPYFLLLLSQNAIDSQYVYLEFKRAKKMNNKLIPVYILRDETDIDSIKNSLKSISSDYAIIDTNNLEESIIDFMYFIFNMAKKENKN